MSGWIAGSAIAVGTVGGLVEGRKTRKAAEAAAAGQEITAAEAEALNIERYGEARELLDPYVGEARTAREQLMIEMGLAPGEAGTAYMEAPGYKAAMKGVEQQMAGTGALYSGRRIAGAEQTQGQFYQNYMNMLQGLGSPGVATNLASLGVGQAATIGQQNIAAKQAAGEYRIAGQQAQQAIYGDIAGAGAQIYGGYLASQAPSSTVPGDAYQPARQAGYL